MKMQIFNIFLCRIIKVILIYMLLDQLLILVFFDDLRVVVRVSVHGKAIAYAQ